MTAPGGNFPGEGFPGGYGRDWWLQALAHAQHLLKITKPDTIIGDDFGDTIRSELIDVTGTAAAAPSETDGAGVVDITVGGLVVGRGRLQPTGCGTHVKFLNGPHYAASLVKLLKPAGDELADTRQDALTLWGDDDNFISIGLMGTESTTKWIGASCVATVVTSVEGPLLDGEESPVWHLFEILVDEAGDAHFFIDGVEFDDPIDNADLPAVPGRLSIVTERTDTGDEAITKVDKYGVFVPSPATGGA